MQAVITVTCICGEQVSTTAVDTADIPGWDTWSVERRPLLEHRAECPMNLPRCGGEGNVYRKKKEVKG